MLTRQHTNKRTTGYGFWLIGLTCLMQSAVYAQSDSEIVESARLCQSVTALSSRLACYDRLLPPAFEVVDSDNGSLASREELAKTVTDLELQLDIDTSSQIIEVIKPDLRTSRLVAADGRVFVQSRAASVIQWPETPFDIEIVRGLLGTKYILVPGRRDRIRISIEE